MRTLRAVAAPSPDVEQRIEALEAAVAALQRRLAPVDDVEFVRTIEARVKGRVFSAAELVNHVSVDKALARVVSSQSAVEIGRRLRRLMGHDVDGWMIARVTRDASGIVWAVVPCALHAGAGIELDADV